MMGARGGAALAFALAALAGAAEAQDGGRVLTADEFAAATEGRTLRFDRYGEPFGAEQYRSENRVTWAFRDGSCEQGIWFENVRGEICFVYEADPVPQCWHFLRMPSGEFHARVVGEDPAADLVSDGRDGPPLDCPLPGPGV